MPRSFRTFPIAITSLALVVAAVVWWAYDVRRTSGAEGPETPGAAASAAEDVVSAADGVASAAPVASGPLPAVGMPLQAVAATLERRSAAGERRVSCRLAMDANLCLSSPQAEEAVRFIERSAASSPSTTEEDLRVIARLEERRAAAESVCAGLDPGWAEDRTWRYMLRAADQGDQRMAVRFAVDPPLDRERILEQVEGWSEYRKRARALLERAAEAGELSAWYYLQQAYAGRPVLIGQANAILPNPYNAAYYAMVVRAFADPATLRDLDGQLADLKPQFDAGTWAEIERKAQDRIRRGFQSPPEVDFDRGVFADDSAGDCDR